MIFVDDQQPKPLKVERRTIRAFSSKYLQVLLWKSGGVFHVRVMHSTHGVMAWAAFRSCARAHEEFNFLVEDWNMQTKFTRFDLLFLTACGIADAETERVTLPNYVRDYMVKNRIPLTRANYLHINGLGQETEELDAETEAEIPEEIANNCGEPSHMTPAGVPICARCGNSTRSMNRLICYPCENGTRLRLTARDRRFLRGLRIAR